MKMVPLFALITLFMLQVGCIAIGMGHIAVTAGELTKSEVENLGFLYLPKEDNCTITFLTSKKPKMTYEVIGNVKTTIIRNMGYRLKETPRQDLDNELRKQACILGGDIVSIDEIVDTSTEESARLQAWSTIIKLK